MELLKKHYDALGSYLHVMTRPSFDEQYRKRSAKLRQRCQAVCAYLRRIFGSTMWNVRAGIVLTFACDRCKTPMVKTVPFSHEGRVVRCLGCEAEYRLERGDTEELTRVCPVAHEIRCPYAECGESSKIWKSDAVLGARWKCGSCGNRFGFQLALAPV
jgi:hypothetical protein